MPPCSRLFGRTTFLAFSVAASLLSGRVFAQDAVVLASDVPGYAPGMAVSSIDRLSVPEGASATLLFQSGEIIRLGGPFEGTLGQQRSSDRESSVATLVEMFRTHSVDATVIGGTRSAGTTRPASTIDDVQIDARRSGTYCVQQSTSVWITRPPGDQHAYAVRRKGSIRTLAWPAGAERVEWPADVPIDEGSQFEIVNDGVARATVTFHALSDVEGSRVATGILLGCHDQFDEKLHRVMQAVVRPELWITTDHGRHPTYRPGEPVTLTIISNIDGYLYCAAGRHDGGAMSLFPASAIDGAQMRGSIALSIPGRRQPAALQAGRDVDQIRCWLADRDITPELPHALLDAPGRRIPDQIADDLDAQFSRIPGTRIQADTLTINVE